MTKNQCVKILTDYNAWRRGAETEMIRPEIVGLAIERAIHLLKQKA